MNGNKQPRNTILPPILKLGVDGVVANAPPRYPHCHSKPASASISPRGTRILHPSVLLLPFFSAGGVAKSLLGYRLLEAPPAGIGIADSIEDVPFRPANLSFWIPV